MCLLVRRAAVPAAAAATAFVSPAVYFRPLATTDAGGLFAVQLGLIVSGLN